MLCTLMRVRRPIPKMLILRSLPIGNWQLVIKNVQSGVVHVKLIRILLKLTDGVTVRGSEDAKKTPKAIEPPKTGPGCKQSAREYHLHLVPRIGGAIRPRWREKLRKNTGHMNQNTIRNWYMRTIALIGAVVTVSCVY